MSDLRRLCSIAIRAANSQTCDGVDRCFDILGYLKKLSFSAKDIVRVSKEISPLASLKDHRNPKISVEAKDFVPLLDENSLFQRPFYLQQQHEACARFQNTGNTDEKKDVVSEHEDKTHCSCNRHCLDPHHRSLSLRRIQLWQISLGTFLPPRDFRGTSLIHFVVLLSLFFVYLQKLPSSNNKLTYNYGDGHNFSYLVENGF
ncbi:hypothetical protein F2Q70_00008285, partial [Brassica cretica]